MEPISTQLALKAIDAVELAVGRPRSYGRLGRIFLYGNTAQVTLGYSRGSPCDGNRLDAERLGEHAERVGLRQLFE